MKLFAALLLVSFTSVLAAPEDVVISNFGVAVLEKEQTAGANDLTSIVAHSKHSAVLSGKAGQRLFVKFNLKGKSGAAVDPEQVFLHLKHESGADIAFIISNKGDQYTFDQVLRSNAFKNLKGSFAASIIIGGSNIKNAVNWNFVNINLDLPTTPIVVPKTQQINYDVLPEIQHLFRQPEKRPSAVISDAFSIICLVPLLGLLVAWSQIGVNFEYAPLSLWTPIFHLGLAGIFGLYFVFWLQLNMFETLKYLTGFVVVTFFAGNRVLSSIAKNKNPSK